MGLYYRRKLRKGLTLEDKKMTYNLCVANNENFEISIDLNFENLNEALWSFEALKNGLCVGYHISVTYNSNGSCECVREVWK